MILIQISNADGQEQDLWINPEKVVYVKPYLKGENCQIGLDYGVEGWEVRCVEKVGPVLDRIFGAKKS